MAIVPAGRNLHFKEEVWAGINLCLCWLRTWGLGSDPARHDTQPEDEACRQKWDFDVCMIPAHGEPPASISGTDLDGHMGEGPAPAVLPQHRRRRHSIRTVIPPAS